MADYHEELFNLTDMYYWTHHPFSGEVLIEAVGEQLLTAQVVGSSDGEPVLARAEFRWNSERRRSFS